MKPKQLTLLFLILTAAVSAGAQSEYEFTLNNGLSVSVIEDASLSLCTAVLVIPKPDGAGESELAEIALLNRYLWLGGAGLGLEIKEHEFRLLAQRFGGSIGSQLTADALLIHYTLPANLTKAVFEHMTVQWSRPFFNRGRLNAVRSTIITEDGAAVRSSVLRQLLREIQIRLWADSPYRFRSYGSENALAAVDVAGIENAFQRMRIPSRWTLIVVGNVTRQTVRAQLEQTLGTLPAGTAPQSNAGSDGEEPRLGIRLQLPVDISRKHVVLAYQLPGSAEVGQELITLLAETMRRSGQAKALQRELSGDGEENGAELNIGFDLRKKTGMFYFGVSWTSPAERNEVIEKLSGFVDTFINDKPDESTFIPAKKALLIRHFSRRQSSQAYAVWRGLRVAVGLFSDEVTDLLEPTKPEDVRKLAAALLTKQNRLTLVTIPK